MGSKKELAKYKKDIQRTQGQRLGNANEPNPNTVLFITLECSLLQY